MSRRGTTPPGTYISLAELGLYYLQSRYYDAEVGRFVNGDCCVNTFSRVQGLHMFCYCYNNPIKYIDPNGKMAVLWLNLLRKLYERSIISGEVAALLTITMNSQKTYVYFHEIAQLNVARTLYRKGYRPELEYKVTTSKGRKEADVVANKRYVWEIKPASSPGSAERQLRLYTEKRTKLKRGFWIPTINDIPFLGDIRMKIQFTSTGGAYYSLYNRRTGKKIKNSDVFWALRALIALSKAVSYGIIVATIAEDIATGGIGVTNDGPSLTAAAASSKVILMAGAKAVMKMAA